MIFRLGLFLGLFGGVKTRTSNETIKSILDLSEMRKTEQNVYKHKTSRLSMQTDIERTFETKNKFATLLDFAN